MRCAFIPLQGLPSQTHCSAEAVTFNQKNLRGMLLLLSFCVLFDFQAALCGQHVWSFVLFDFPSLYSLKTVICASHHPQHENLLGCTPSLFYLCFVCASLHHWRPLVLSAFDASVSVSACAMCHAHMGGVSVPSLSGPSSYLFVIMCPFSVPFFPSLAWSCFFCFSQSCGVRNHLRSPCCKFLLPVFCWVPHWCSSHHTWPNCFCQRFHPLVEGHVRTA